MGGPLERGRWHTFVLGVKWSSSATIGLFELWVDGELVVAPTSRPTTFLAGGTPRTLRRSRRRFADPHGRSGMG